MTEAEAGGALDGLRVLDLSQGMAGPLATMVMADHGADVIKVEPSSGDRGRSVRGFHMWNRGKRSIAVDLDVPPDIEVVLHLSRWADVIVGSTARDADGVVRIEGSSLTEARLLAANDRAIHCYLDTWGPVRRVDDHHESSLAAITGRMASLDRLSGGLAHPHRSGPGFTLPPVASFGAAMLATQGILAALLNDTGLGRPAIVRTSLLQGAVSFMMREGLEVASPEAPRTDGHAAHLLQRGIELCFLTAACADGRYIQMCARQDHHFRAWLEALGLTDVLADPRFAAAPLGIGSEADLDELEGLLRERMRSQTQEEWMRTFTEEFDIGADPFLTPEEFLAHPQMTANGRVIEVHDPELGATTQVGPLVAMSALPAQIQRPAPRLDEHRAEILALVADRADAEADADLDAGVRSSLAAPAASDGAARRGPLHGITVIEAAYFVAGPLATTLLAELGARVIKIEPLAGDPYRRTGMQSTKFLHGKESIALDLKAPEGLAVLDRLLERADVVVHSFRLGVPERLGIGWKRLHGLNDQLVYLNAASYGSAGPEAGRIAFHSTPTALSGAGILQAGEGNPPVDDSFPDPAAGLGAATAILLGLVARRRSGKGLHLETTMLCSTGYVMSADTVLVDGSTRARSADRDQLGLGALHRLYRCRDRWLFLAVTNDAAWSAAMAVLGIDPSSIEPQVALAAPVHGPLGDRLAEIFGLGEAAVWAKRLGQAGVDAVVVGEQPFEKWLENEGVLELVEHDRFGAYLRLPPKVTVEPAASMLGQACSVSEHADALLRELGYGSEDIDRLRSAAVVG